MLGPDVFRGATDVANGELDVEVFDGREPTLRNLIFDADGHLERAGSTQQVPRAMQSWSELQVGSRPWTVSISASDQFEFVSRGPLLILLCSGWLLSGVASFLVYNQSTAAMRAKALAMSMTDDLRRLAMVAEHTTNAVLITDRHGGIVWTNKGFSHMTGLRRDDVRGRQAVEVMRSGYTDATTVEAMCAAFDSGTSYRGHVQGRRADGAGYWADANIEPIHGENTALEGFVVVESDITEQVKERERAESTLREVEGLWNTIDSHSIVSISDSDGRIEDVNEAFCKISGYTRDELVGKDHRLLNAGYHNASFWRDLWTTVQSGKTWRGEICNRAKDGSIFWVDSIITPFHDSADRIEKYVSIRQDITDRKLAEEELRVAARTDKLTGLPNRALFNDRLQQAVLRGERNKDYHFAVLFLDFDRFKLINDSLGHNVGDQLLQAIATRLRNAIRSVDTAGLPYENTAARLGGDEFVVLLDGLSKPQDAVVVAERLLEAFAAPYTLGEHEVYSSASIGVVTSDTGAGSAEAILRDADTAMYEAKLAGKSRYVLFDVSMRQRVQRRMNVERDLRKVLETNQLTLHYQPIVNLRTGEVHSVEALIRWNHPERGPISPAEFIPVAEDTGLIVPIGEWVLREACRQFAQWKRELGTAAPASISVNLSRVQLMLHNLPQSIARILAETGVTPSCLHLEVTESAVMKDIDTGVRLLRAIKETGVQIDLDDFGTGYSSLASLHQFPIDVLKIDRSFIANINRGRDFAALVYAVSQLARNLNIEVVAEGIETMEQAAVLLSLDYDLGQGYLFSKPLPAAKVPTFRVHPELLRSAHDTEPFSAA
jgi:diguanylate cyclase (GGDEF)-like protein/PAS domain S-box-containing protein